LSRRQKISETMKKKFQEIPHWTLGQTAWNKGKKRWWDSPNCFKKGMTPWNKGKKFPQVTGDKNPRWNGGISPEYKRIRNCPEMRELKRQILIRDSFTCKECGQHGGKLEVHHIKPFCLYPELRFERTNVITLCKSCHKKTDTYKRSALLFVGGSPKIFPSDRGNKTR
jgi:hypothetical protein